MGNIYEDAVTQGCFKRLLTAWSSRRSLDRESHAPDRKQEPHSLGPKLAKDISILSWKTGEGPHPMHGKDEECW